jgi:HK97 family phage prohead protease
MRIKNLPARIKASGEPDGLKPGEFKAIVSVFGNRDSYGDVMMAGAFGDTLAAWKSSGDPIPVLWSHDWLDPMSHIGVVLDAREVHAGEMGDGVPAGLWVHGANDVESNTRAAQVSRLMAGRRITQFSFAFDEVESGPIVHEGVPSWGISKVNLFEVGPTLLGVNQETELLGAKRMIIDLAARSKAGARHSDADLASLRSIHDALGALGVSCDPQAGKGRQGSAGSDDTDTQGGKGVEPEPILSPAKTPFGARVLAEAWALEYE